VKWLSSRCAAVDRPPIRLMSPAKLYVTIHVYWDGLPSV
jgi:hypothetical protein